MAEMSTREKPSTRMPTKEYSMGPGAGLANHTAPTMRDDSAAACASTKSVKSFGGHIGAAYPIATRSRMPYTGCKNGVNELGLKNRYPTSAAELTTLMTPSAIHVVGRGVRVGAGVGDSEGDHVGCSVGSGVGAPGRYVGTGVAVGAAEGTTLGVSVGEAVGEKLGCGVGDSVGALEGDAVGERVGSIEGDKEGSVVGCAVGDAVGSTDGDPVVGLCVGAAVVGAAVVGLCVGEAVVGLCVGEAVVGAEVSVGLLVGNADGAVVCCAPVCNSATTTSKGATDKSRIFLEERD